MCTTITPAINTTRRLSTHSSCLCLRTDSLSADIGHLRSTLSLTVRGPAVAGPEVPGPVANVADTEVLPASGLCMRR